MQAAQRCGILLVNTGTPAAPRPQAVRKYLAKFLMDRRIAPMNRVGWWLILHLCILPRRGKVSAEKYKAIWSEEGSPFAVAHEKLVSGLSGVFEHEGRNVVVACGMSYSEPSIRKAVRELKEAGCDRLIVLPLYPQSALSTTGSVSDSIGRELKKAHWDVPCDFVENYHGDPTYVKALASSLLHAGFAVDSTDKVLFSFHSIPLKDIEAGDTYELQAGSSSLQVAGELGIERSRWTIGYHCRFDKARDWLSPYTKDVLSRWAEADVGRVFLICPGFAVDCLETLYDIGHELKPYYFKEIRDRGREPIEENFVYVPCLDRSRAHVKVLSDVLRPYLEEDCNE